MNVCKIKLKKKKYNNKNSRILNEEERNIFIGKKRK